MSVTRPSSSSKVTRSPIRIGCETAIWIPAMTLARVRWAAKPTTATISAVEARTPVASCFSSVNWLSASIATTRKTARKASRRRMRNRVRVERETCETAGDMESNLAAAPVAEPAERQFPPSNWGPQGALLGAVLAIVVGLVLGLPAVAFTDSAGNLTTAGNVIAQFGLVIGLLGVPLAVAHSRGARTLGECLRRLGVRRFRLSALKWMAASVGAYLAFAAVYSALILEPEQEDIAESFGPLPVQILLIVLAAAVAEEICFRGMLFGGLRERLPRWAAALIAGAVFGLLHAFTGISAVPPLIFFGFVLCLLYEKTGSVVPGMILHALNNSVALLAQ